MSLWKCPRCQRRFDDDDSAVMEWQPTTVTGSGHWVSGCRICLPLTEKVQPGKAEPIWPEEFER